jgi:sugar phosphate isomerase/epimerase
MIYISSSSSKKNNISAAVNEICDQGITNIELSGGTTWYKGFEKDLVRLQENHNINFLLHNYFPPPSEHFVLNLASLDDDIYTKSIDHIKKAIDLSVKLKADKYAFHAGFYYDIPVNEIGKPLTKAKLNNKIEATNRFVEAYKIIELYNNNRITLYIENNVLNEVNYKSFGCNPLMLTCLEDYTELKKQLDFNLLIDLAHLYVTCNTLSKAFEEEAKQLVASTNYIHISDNDGTRDSNNKLIAGSPIDCLLNNVSLKNKTITLEVYDNYSSILESYKQISNKC